MSFEYQPHLKQERKEKVQTNEWFMSQFGNLAQVRVRQGEVSYDTNVNQAYIEERDGKKVFVLKIPIDGQVETFESDRPDQFVGVTLL